MDAFEAGGGPPELEGAPLEELPALITVQDFRGAGSTAVSDGRSRGTGLEKARGVAWCKILGECARLVPLAHASVAQVGGGCVRRLRGRR